jgi:hypothetical protein
MIYELTTAFVGFEAAVSFRDFCEKYESQVLVEDILDNGELEKVAEFSINDHSALVEKMEAKKVFEDILTENQVQNLVNYFVSIPSEVAMKLFTVVGNSGENGQKNVIQMHGAHTADGVKCADVIVELITGKRPEDN